MNDEYYVINKEYIFFDKEEIISFIRFNLDNYDNVSIDCRDASLSDKPVIAYHFNDEDGDEHPPRNYVAFESQEDLDIFRNQHSYTSHFKLIPIKSNENND